MPDLLSKSITFIRKSYTSLSNSILLLAFPIWPCAQPASHVGGPGLILDWGGHYHPPTQTECSKWHVGGPILDRGAHNHPPTQTSAQDDPGAGSFNSRTASLHVFITYVHTYQHVGTYAQRRIHGPRSCIQELYFWTVSLPVSDPTKTTPKHRTSFFEM